MKFFGIALLLLYSFVSDVTAQISDLKGWGNTRWGVTEAEILANVPEARRVEPRKYFNERYATVVIDTFMVANIPFDVSFVMSGETKKLELVTMNCLVKVTQTDFEDVLTSLTNKYGTPTNQNRKETKRYIEADIRWLFETSKVDLSFIDAPKISNTLNIRYAPKFEIGVP